jgi:hypothetical protein
VSFDTDLPGDLTDDDRLFNVDRGPWEMNTRMDWTFLREYRYIAGFERAAQVLGDRAAESGADVDALTMPILFCYRQWAELQLKALWSNGSRLIGREQTPYTTHDLRVLWRHVRPIVETVWPDGDRAELDRLERVLHELADFDGPRGIGFRYATDKNGRASLPSELTINLGNVRSVMEKAALLLNGAAEGIAELLSYTEEDMQDY